MPVLYIFMHDVNICVVIINLKKNKYKKIQASEVIEMRIL